MSYAIDRFAWFDGALLVEGWVIADGPPALVFDDGYAVPLDSWGQPSPDVAAHFPGADHVRFRQRLDIGDRFPPAARLEWTVAGEHLAAANLGAKPDPARDMISRFLGALPAEGELLEIGSRARSGVTRRDLLPPAWDYVGLDVLDGPNVDVVGDAHQLSRLFARGRFDAVMALSVIEHIAMPWKLAIELNRVLKPGGMAYFSTHQGWPVHDAPWDFWRFSDQAWQALFNPATGFEVVEARMGEPAFVVAESVHAVTAFGLGQGVFLASNVLVRKIAETTLDWPVELEDITRTMYPEGETTVVGLREGLAAPREP